jgi:hypothetical protein
MAASIETVREKMDVKPTPEDKGLLCTIRVTAYDKGVIEVDGRPVSTSNRRIVGSAPMKLSG